DPRQGLAVELEHGLHELGRELLRGRRQRLDLVEQRVDALHRAQCISPNIGEWTCLIVLPPPRYMCTPHGRHGSNERTARMMSMPLKFSLEFSSKIGVVWTASSYGPGVP